MTVLGSAVGFTLGDGARVDGRGWVVRDAAFLDAALLVESGASVHVTGFDAADVGFGGVRLVDGSTLVLEDAVIRRVEADPLFTEGATGYGLLSVDSDLTLRRVQIEQASALAAQLGGTVAVADLVIRDVREVDQRAHGVVFANATGTAERVTVSGVGRVAVGVSGGALTMSDLSMSDVRVVDSTNVGAGLIVAGGLVTVARARVERTVRDAIYVALPGGELRATDLAVDTAAMAPCSGGDCQLVAGGRGLTVFDAGRVDVERFAIRAATFAGVAVVQTGAAELRNGIIADSGIAVLDDETAAIILEAVTLDNNEIDFTRAMIALPDPRAGLEL